MGGSQGATRSRHDPVDRAIRAVPIAAVAVSALALGGGLPEIFVPISLVVIGVALLTTFRPMGLERAQHPAAVVLGLLSLFCAVQALPLPLSLVRVLSPSAADVWSRCMLPVGTTKLTSRSTT